MAEEIDDAGFYREDFSTESEWEVFVHHLGEVFLKWELGNCENWGRELASGELFTCKWSEQTSTLELLKKKIDVIYYVAELKDQSPQHDIVESEEQCPPVHKDLMSLKNTFGPASTGELHTLARLYGLRRFVVIHPHNLQSQFLTHPAEFSFFLSAATVCASEVLSTVPIFVQIYDPKWNFYLGVSAAARMRTNFDLVALDQAPPDCRYLAGLLSIFKDKLPSTYLQPATVSVRNTYALDTMRLRIPMRLPFSQVAMVEEELNESKDIAILDYAQFIALPYGYFPDSCTDMYINYTWPEIAENIAIDSELRTDFVPSKAPCVSIHHAVRATSYLTSCLHDYLKLQSVIQSLEAFVGRNFSGSTSAPDINNPLNQLTHSNVGRLRAHRPSGSYTAVAPSPAKKIAGPMNESELSQMLCYLFPDSYPNSTAFAYARDLFKSEFDPQRVKSAVPDSLICRLSCLLATCHAHFGGKNGLSQLWAAFTRQLRTLWDECAIIPGVAPGFPDTRTCLLHQKLQMLNVCIKRRQLRESGEKQKELNESDNSDSENEDEFYDCINDEQDPALIKPEGREKKLGDMKLLDCDETLYVPITQEPVPKTEDQLLDDAAVMLKLGPGSGLTTQMMCSSLLSDMEAFKAANPKAKMEDFIRWYSPKDWEETTDDDGNTVGKLSARMLAPKNTWQLVWKEARHVAASRQKRLFDDTNEALKVLHYLETRTIGEIYELTIVPILHAAILKLKDTLTTCGILDIFESQINHLLTDLCRLSRDVEVVGQTEYSLITQTPNLEPFIKSIDKLEMGFYQYKCFERFSQQHAPEIDLTDIKEQFKAMLEQGGSCKGAKANMFIPTFSSEMSDKLISKDYVIRVDGETTASTKEMSGPQFLRAIITGEKIRLCGAFTENTSFI